MLKHDALRSAFERGAFERGAFERGACGLGAFACDERGELRLC